MQLLVLALRLAVAAAGLQHTLSSNRGYKSGLRQPGAQQGTSESYLIWTAPETTPLPEVNFKVSPGTDHRSEWAEFNAVLHPYLVKDSFITQTPEATQVLSITAQQPWVKTICETGFGAGHSAMLFLLANPDAEVYSFGLGNEPYSNTSEKFLHRKFGDRFTLTRGDSTKSLPSFMHKHPGVRCDLVLVDGAYDKATVHSDIQNFRQIANSMNQVLFVMDTPCPAKWCMGRGAAFRQAIKKQEIVPVSRLKVSELHGLSSAWFTAVATTPAVPASNFETLGHKAFLAASSGGSL